MRSLTDDEAGLLRKLYRSRKIGGSHLLEENLLRGFPRHRTGDFRQALQSLKRDGILFAKATAHGPAVSTPATLAREIHQELRKRWPNLLGPR